MKKLTLLLGISLLFSCGQNTEHKEYEQVSNEPQKDHIAVYDFHTEHRCQTCLAIEKATKETLNKNFKTELDNQTITFSLINADAEENQNLAEEYAAFGTTLAITIFKGDQKEIIDITNWAFDAVNGERFETELTKKLNDALEKL